MAKFAQSINPSTPTSKHLAARSTTELNTDIGANLVDGVSTRRFMKGSAGKGFVKGKKPASTSFVATPMQMGGKMKKGGK